VQEGPIERRAVRVGELAQQFTADPVVVEIMTGCFMLLTQLERLNAGDIGTEDVADMLATVAGQAHGENGLRNLGAATDVVSRWGALQSLIGAALAKHDVHLASFERLQRAVQALDAGPPADVLAAAAAEVEAAAVAEDPATAATAS
jgi:hypothetical protein